MSKLQGFFHKCKTNLGYPIGIVGLTSAENIENILPRLANISLCNASENDDIVTIDIALVDTAKAVCKADVFAVGLSINAYDKGLATGGVIGNPCIEYASAEDKLEQIGEDLWCYSEAGSGGFVAHCDKVLAEQICREFCISPSLESFEKTASAFGLRTYIYVSDGAGNDGRIAVSAENIKKSAKISR